MTQPLLRMSGMSVELPVADRTVDIIEDIDLELERGERLGVVGESGSGKPITALAVMGLLPSKMRVRGQLTFDGGHVVIATYEKIPGSNITSSFTIASRSPRASRAPRFHAGFT